MPIWKIYVTWLAATSNTQSVHCTWDHYIRVFPCCAHTESEVNTLKPASMTKHTVPFTNTHTVSIYKIDRYTFNTESHTRQGTMKGKQGRACILKHPNTCAPPNLGSDTWPSTWEGWWVQTQPTHAHTYPFWTIPQLTHVLQCQAYVQGGER